MKYENVEDLLKSEGYQNFYQFGRSLYKNVGCGPWCQLVDADGEKIYYESNAATASIDKVITGLEIGSIVEGSDVEIGPEFLEFPFTDEQLWEVVKNIDEEANFYWERDNQDDFIIEVDEATYYMTTGFGIEFSENTPQTVKNMVENFWDLIEAMEEGEVIEFSDYKITKVDKSGMLY